MKDQIGRWMKRLGPLLLAGLFCYIAVASLSTIGHLQGNARVINYTGIVRGATQRLVKQEMNGMPNEALALELDGILAELSGGTGANGLIALPDETFQRLLGEMRLSWAQLRREIDRVRQGGDSGRLFTLSEDYFVLADQTASAAEQYSERQVRRATETLLLLDLAFVVLVVLFWLSGRRQKRVQRALDQAEIASRAKSEFLSRMSHEIRTPMNGIIGMTAIARLSVDDREKLLDCLSKIDLSSSYLLALINDVLDMSRIESGKLEITPAPFSLRALVESITSLYYAQAKERQIHFETVLVGEVPAQVYGDSLRLNQILANLLSNALKFTPAGGTIRLRVSISDAGDGPPRFCFQVQDTGRGIAEENFEKIFEAFEQENGAVSHTYGGTGLGLSIVKRLAELMGGGVSLQSRLGQGSTFSVELPLTVPDGEAQLPCALRGAALVAGGDGEGRRAVQSRLANLGMEVFTAADGRELLEIFRREAERGPGVELCLINYVLPDMDALEAVKRLRQMAGGGRARLFLAAYDTSGLEGAARQAGADGVLTKPLFRSTVLEALSRSRREDAPAAKGQPQAYDFHGKHILLAEDNALNREIALELLGATGAILDAVDNGRAAADRFLASPVGYYDLILMDVQMPQMDGYAATREIRSQDRPDAAEVPIFAMTANAFVEDMRKSREAGMNAHISKPLDIGAIYRQLEELFRTGGA